MTELERMTEERDRYRKLYYDLLASIPDIREETKQAHLEDLSERMKDVLRKYL